MIATPTNLHCNFPLSHNGECELDYDNDKCGSFDSNQSNLSSISTQNSASSSPVQKNMEVDEIQSAKSRRMLFHDFEMESDTESCARELRMRVDAEDEMLSIWSKKESLQRPAPLAKAYNIQSTRISSPLKSEVGEEKTLENLKVPKIVKHQSASYLVPDRPVNPQGRELSYNRNHKQQQQQYIDECYSDLQNYQYLQTMNQQLLWDQSSFMNLPAQGFSSLYPAHPVYQAQAPTQYYQY